MYGDVVCVLVAEQTNPQGEKPVAVWVGRGGGGGGGGRERWSDGVGSLALELLS